MPNQFTSLVVPSSVSSGAAVDVSGLGISKTIICGGTFDATINVEYATDDTGTDWAPIATFHGPGIQYVTVAAHWMRATVVAYDSGAAEIAMGASDTGTAGVQVPTPAANAPGATVDISGLPPYKTVVVSGLGSAEGALNIEVSEDGTHWAQVMTFHKGGGQSGSFYGALARARATGDFTPTIWMGSGSADDTGTGWPVFPIIPAGEPVTTTIYARTTGNDATGNGTLANPFRTFARAIRQVPQVINPGYRYIVDITDLGIELLPQDWTSPPIVGSQFGWNDPAPIQPYIIRSAPLVIRALPQLALSGGDAIIAAADTATVANVGPGLCKITIGAPRAAWVAHSLKGKQIVRTVGSSAATCCIYDNSTTELFLCNTAGSLNGGTGALVLAPGETVNIVEPSATLTAPPSPLGDPISWNMACGVTFQGIKFVCTVADAGNGSIGLTGAIEAPFFELCDIDGTDFATSGGLQVGLFSTTMRDYCNAFDAQITPRRSYWDVPEGVQLDGLVNQFRSTVFETGSALSTFYTAPAGPAQALSISLLNCWFKGAPADAVTVAAPSRVDLTTCQIDNSGGNAVTATGPCQAVLAAVTGTGNTGYGVQLIDGAHVQVDAATTVIGGTGAYKNGAEVAVGAWPGAPFSDPDPDELTRIWRS